jgi:hypothetical protein
VPDIEVIDLTNRTAAVNRLVLYDLTERAERQSDPFKNLEALYHIAEVAWASGRFKPAPPPAG